MTNSVNNKIVKLRSLIDQFPSENNWSNWFEEIATIDRKTLSVKGFPSNRTEYWRNTPTDKFLVSNSTVPNYNESENSTLSKEVTSTQLMEGIDCISLVFVDGVFRDDLSDTIDEYDGLDVEIFKNSVCLEEHWVSEIFGKLMALGQKVMPRPFALLNSLVARQGIFVRVSKKLIKPIKISYRVEKIKTHSFIRNLLIVDSDVEVSIFEEGVSGVSSNYIWEMDLAAKAKLNHTRIQNLDRTTSVISHCFSRLNENSTYSLVNISLNGETVRNETFVSLQGKNSSATVAGLSVGKQANCLNDDTVYISHESESCKSRQISKKVLSKGATGVFQGKIFVEAIAQETDGYQMSKGLLIDEGSNFLVKPELEIYADDVLCSHGSVSGTIDENELFYLTSRGIPPREARKILILAFLDEVIDEVEDESVASEIKKTLTEWVE
jgi:Fe-S cluster assembly protein SufD